MFHGFVKSVPLVRKVDIPLRKPLSVNKKKEKRSIGMIQAILLAIFSSFASG